MTSLRLLTESDFNHVWTIFKNVFEHKYITEFQDVWKARDPNLSFGIVDEQRILVGFLLTKEIQNNHYQIEFIGVSPQIQKGGIGTLLLRKVLSLADSQQWKVTLIPVNDERIIGWYKKHGFLNWGEPRISLYTGDLEQVMIYTK